MVVSSRRYKSEMGKVLTQSCLTVAPLSSGRFAKNSPTYFLINATSALQLQDICTTYCNGFSLLWGIRLLKMTGSCMPCFVRKTTRWYFVGYSWRLRVTDSISLVHDLLTFSMDKHCNTSHWQHSWKGNIVNSPLFPFGAITS